MVLVRRDMIEGQAEELVAADKARNDPLAQEALLLESGMRWPYEIDEH